MKRRVPLDIEFLLEGILDESPDEINIGGAKYEWNDMDFGPVAFMTFETFSLLGYGKTHYGIMSNLGRAAEADNPAAHFKELHRQGKVLFSDINAAAKEVVNVNTKLGKYLKKYGTYEANMRYRTELGLAGRIWTEKKFIAFWNKQEDVKAKWDSLEKMFTAFKRELGDLDDYQIDWIERVSTNPLTPAKTIRSDPKQQNFMDDLFANKNDKMSNQQIKMLQQKIHTLPPEKKKQALALLGAKNHKASEIADKLGISVAEFNHLMQLNENSIPLLMEILKEIQDKKI